MSGNSNIWCLCSSDFSVISAGSCSWYFVSWWLCDLFCFVIVVLLWSDFLKKHFLWEVFKTWEEDEFLQRDLLLLLLGTWGHHCTRTTLNLLLGFRFFNCPGWRCLGCKLALKLSGYRFLGDILSSSSQLAQTFEMSNFCCSLLVMIVVVGKWMIRNLPDTESVTLWKLSFLGG